MLAVSHRNNNLCSIADNMVICDNIPVIRTYKTRSQAMNFLFHRTVTKELLEKRVVAKCISKRVLVFSHFSYINTYYRSGCQGHGSGYCIFSAISNILPCLFKAELIISA